MNQYQNGPVEYLKAKPSNPQTLSPEDFAKIAENRSLYGNYVDNAITYDPYKDKKPVYDIIYTQDQWDPWGKPGGGAPLFDRNTGKLKTKLEGTMQWNLDGQTPSARLKRMHGTYREQPSLVNYRKTPNSTIKLPLPHEATTHRQVFGGIDNANIAVPPSRSPNQLPPLQQQNQSIDYYNNNVNENFKHNQTNIEREAELRNLNKYKKSNYNSTNFSSENYDDTNNNQYAQTSRVPNYSNMWFGRTGKLDILKCK